MSKCINPTPYLYEVYVAQGYHLNPQSLSQLDLDLVSA